jgi:hypothetical protein
MVSETGVISDASQEICGSGHGEPFCAYPSRPGDSLIENVDEFAVRKSHPLIEAMTVDVYPSVAIGMASVDLLLSGLAVSNRHNRPIAKYERVDLIVVSRKALSHFCFRHVSSLPLNYIHYTSAVDAARTTLANSEKDVKRIR